jgi:hypothetical protein
MPLTIQVQYGPNAAISDGVITKFAEIAKSGMNVLPIWGSILMQGGFFL